MHGIAGSRAEPSVAMLQVRCLGVPTYFGVAYVSSLAGEAGLLLTFVSGRALAPACCQASSVCLI